MAASALGYRSLDGTDALPALAHCLTNRNILLSETAASAIKRISQRRGWVAPGHYYTGDDSFFNQKANDPAYTAQFRARARSIVPLLVKALQDTNSIVGTFVADALKEIDPDTAATVKLP